RAKALELHLRLEEEEATFADLASTYSQGAEQQLNGLIGPMELGRINPVLAERLRISTPGQLWPPFEAEGWWVILRHERHLPAQLDAAMTQRLIGEMYEQWMFEQVSAALQALESTAPEPAGDAPAPSTELPAADALQPSPAADAPAESRRGLFKSIFGLG
ncbi:MAG: peptidylprolyl isomerase, partial [Vulcanococcus sp.]